MRTVHPILTGLVALACGLAPVLPARATEPRDLFDLSKSPPADFGQFQPVAGGSWIHVDPDGWYNMIVLDRSMATPSPLPEEGFDYRYVVGGKMTAVVIFKEPSQVGAKASGEMLEAVAQEFLKPGSPAEPGSMVVTNRRMITLGGEAGRRGVAMASWEGQHTQGADTTWIVIGAVPTRKGMLWAHCASSRSLDACRSLLANGLRLEQGAY